MRIGVNVGHFTGRPPPDLVEKVRALDEAGFASLWFAEAYGADVFTPLAFCAAARRLHRAGCIACPLEHWDGCDRADTGAHNLIRCRSTPAQPSARGTE